MKQNQFPFIIHFAAQRAKGWCSILSLCLCLVLVHLLFIYLFLAGHTICSLQEVSHKLVLSP
jgi:hypothetical protein